MEKFIPLLIVFAGGVALAQILKNIKIKIAGERVSILTVLFALVGIAVLIVYVIK